MADLAERTRLGRVVAPASNTTTTFTLTTAGASELRGPFTGAGIAIGSPVVTLNETSGTAGEDSFVSNWVPSTGVLTILPAIAETDVTSILILDPMIGHADRIIEAINRGLTERCSRRMLVPLTYVPDGDLLATTVADFWTASAGTASYVSTAVPEVVGQLVLQISHTSAATLTSNTIPVRAGEIWRFATAIRAATDGDTATFSVQDITNTAEITATYENGATAATTSRGFVSLVGQFTVPATCDRIAFRIAVSGSGTMTAQMGQIVAYPQDARSFPLQQRVIAPEERVGNFYQGRWGGTATGPDERNLHNALLGGRKVSFTQDGDHLVVMFNFAPGLMWYEELVYGTELSAMADTTIFPKEQVLRWAKYELLRWLYEGDLAKGDRADNGVNIPSRWRSAAREAWRQADRSQYEPDLVTLTGRR